MPEDNQQERTETATPKRREEARKKGQVPKSIEINTAIILLVTFLFLKLYGGYFIDKCLYYGRVMFENIGNQDLINVKWEIYVTKGIILKREILNKTGLVNVTTELPVYVTTGFSSLKHKFGLVNVSVVATVDGHIFTESTRGLVVGRLFIKF